MSVLVQPASLELLPSFREALDQVAREKRFIEMIEAPTMEEIYKFHGGLIENGAPTFFAVENGNGNSKVVGWCDITPMKNPRLAHRGTLGMGLSPGFRGQGLGSQLLKATLDAAEKFGLEKVELTVYTSNTPARRLYEKHGFEAEGVIKSYRKLEGQVFDCVLMAKRVTGPVCFPGASGN